MKGLSHAFVLGAGRGLRLRPLTENLPKPLIPLHGRPLAAFALEHLATAGVRHAVINTHHAASCWEKAFPTHTHAGLQLTFRFEPTLLDTGGGLKNVEDFLIHHGAFLVYNADLWTTLPLEKAIAHHQQHANLATLVLRSQGGPKHVALDSAGQITDIRGLLGKHEGAYLFTGIHVVEPAIFAHIPAVRVESIISIYLRLIREGHRIGGVVLDEGTWSDVGTLDEYERVKRAVNPKSG